MWLGIGLLCTVQKYTVYAQYCMRDELLFAQQVIGTARKVPISSLLKDHTSSHWPIVVKVPTHVILSSVQRFYPLRLGRYLPCYPSGYVPTYSP